MSEPTIEALMFLVFVWAFFEAIAWPVMPDAILVPVCVTQPGHSGEFLGLAVLGMACGGAITYWITARSNWLKLQRLPLVRKSMIEQATIWFEKEGPRAVLHQALSALPFKVFAGLAGELNIPFIPFLTFAILVRGARFAVVAALSAMGGTLLPGFVRENGAVLLIVWVLVFGLGLAGTVRYWERR